MARNKQQANEPAPIHWEPNMMTQEEYECYCWEMADLEAEHRAEKEAESAWLRHAENASWMELAAEDAYNAANGLYEYGLR